MVVAGTAERLPHRLAHLVFVDAFVPEDGQALLDLLPPDRRAYYRWRAAEDGDGRCVPPPPPAALGVTNPDDLRLLAERLSPQPLRTFEQPVRLRNRAAAALSRTYTHCMWGPIVASFAPFARRYRLAPGWGCHELATGHDAMLTGPRELAGLLLQIGERGLAG